SDNIDDRVNCTDLMKMNLLGRFTMKSSFHFGETPKGRERAVLHVVGNSALRDQILNLVKMAMGLLPRYLDLNVSARQPATQYTLDLEFVFTEVEFPQFSEQVIARESRVQQGT